MGIKIDSRYQQESLNKYLGQGTYLKNAQEIEKWCRSTFEGKKLWERRLPSSIAKDEYEKKLGVKLHHIRQNVLKKYEGKELGEIKDKEDRKIVEIIRRLDKEYKIPAQDKKKIKKQEEKYGTKTDLKNVQEIEEWCKTTFEGKKVWERRTPRETAKDEYEKKLGQKLAGIRQKVLKQHEGKKLEEIKDEEDRKIVEIIRTLDKEYGMKADLKNVQEIEEWCKTTFEGKKVWERRTPSETAKNEYEKKLGKRLNNVRQNILKKYEGKEIEEIEDEEDRKIVETIRTLDKEYGMKADLKNAQEIEEWCISTFEGKKVWERRLPSPTAKEEYEKKLGKRLNNVRQNILKKYEGKEIEEIEDEEDRKIVETIRTLDKEYGMKADLKNAQEIEEWCRSTFEGKKVWERRLPSEAAKEEYEKKLGQSLNNVRQKVLKKYEGKKLEEIEDEEDRKIVEIIRNLDKEYKISLEDKKKMKKQAEMENEAAKTLCSEYEAELKKQEGKKGENK